MILRMTCQQEHQIGREFLIIIVIFQRQQNNNKQITLIFINNIEKTNRFMNLTIDKLSILTRLMTFQLFIKQGYQKCLGQKYLKANQKKIELIQFFYKIIRYFIVLKNTITLHDVLYGNQYIELEIAIDRLVIMDFNSEDVLSAKGLQVEEFINHIYLDLLTKISKYSQVP
ncbi:unnamed protein product [Paramecium octaurelia]|uniref:Uncharacterized protein n=1 Tax=Paramecium octaurelia TaxID=43137 RepID=A0A8S1TD98_PAROT|nr:unnamed protein product [Paramecium octaurelia]CAD8149828.1 unnamed protein product [Paramecium octaurelia]